MIQEKGYRPYHLEMLKKCKKEKKKKYNKAFDFFKNDKPQEDKYREEENK